MQLDAICQKVREGGSVRRVATFARVGIHRKGYREVIGCQVATSEHEIEWKEFLRRVKNRGLNTPEFIILGCITSVDHVGLRGVLQKQFAEGIDGRTLQDHYGDAAECTT